MIGRKSRRKTEPARRRVRIEDLSTEVRARVALSGEAMAEYAKAMVASVPFPPIVVFEDGEALWLADGHHRVEAARCAGRKVVRAEVYAGGRREALLHACGANAAHGVRRTSADKRRTVTLMLSQGALTVDGGATAHLALATLSGASGQTARSPDAAQSTRASCARSASSYLRRIRR